MVVVGLILLVAGVVALIDMGASSHGSNSVHLLGWHLGAMGPGRLLLLGVAIGAVLMLGLVSALAGQRRARRRNRAGARTVARTRAENKRLTEELAEQRAQAPSAARDDEQRQVPPLDDDREPEHVQVSTGTVDAYPAEAYPAGAEYVLGSRYPQESSAGSTPPMPPAPEQR